MKRFILCLICLCMALVLLGCTDQNSSDVPKGYQRASDKEKDGYALYVPRGWTCYREGDTNCAYVSNMDRSFVSARTVLTDLSPEQWFDDSAEEFERVFETVTVLETDKNTKISDRETYIAVYTASYDGKTYGFRQAVVQMDVGRLLVISCSAAYDTEEPLPESRYAAHATDFANIVAEVVVYGTPEKLPEPSFEGQAPEGMKPACDSDILGCDFFVPEDWTLAFSDGEVNASAEDGTNVRFSEVAPGQNTVDKYWEYLLSEYEKRYDTVTVTKDDHKAESVDGCPAYLYCFTVTEDGAEYNVSQYIITKKTGLRTGVFLLTYTVCAENEAVHTTELEDIVGAISFK